MQCISDKNPRFAYTDIMDSFFLCPFYIMHSIIFIAAAGIIGTLLSCCIWASGEISFCGYSRHYNSLCSHTT